MNMAALHDCLTEIARLEGDLAGIRRAPASHGERSGNAQLEAVPMPA
jgi:hypothetical protein